MNADVEFNSATVNVTGGTKKGYSYFQTVSTNYGASS